MIKYIGSKRALIDIILAVVRAASPQGSLVVDPFSGSARVGCALKGAGYRVSSGDLHKYAATLAGCYVAADAALLPVVEAALGRVSAAPPVDGWFAETYCRTARFFRPENGARIEGFRAAIDREAPLDGPLRDVLLTALMEAADRVDSTVGLQMAFLKAWAPRALAPIELRVPALLPGEGRARQADAVDLLLGEREADLVYLDPPYNQHKYLSNYHIWETLVTWDQPEVYGVAQKRLDCRTVKSMWNSRHSAPLALHQLVEAVQAPMILMSMSAEGFLTRGQICDRLLRRPGSHLLRVAVPHRRHVGSKIGVYNPQGKRVGAEGADTTEEHLYLSGPPDRVRLALEALRGAPFRAELVSA